MTKEFLNLPTTPTWRDIPQPIKPRAMSSGGRWRLARATMRATALLALIGTLAWGGWKVVAALQENPAFMPAAAKAVPIKPPHLLTDGVLDDDWLVRTLALPKNASLMSLDLEKLQARLLGEGQVLTANLTRKFPDQLVVQITERTPVARVMAEWGGQARELLVARDGIVFVGDGHAPAMIATLPWLDGMKIVRRGDEFLPIAGIPLVSELLATARLEAEHLYRSWRVVSLARLVSDGEIEVRTVEGVAIVFSAGDPGAPETMRRQHFFRQLARLDYMWDQIAHLPAAQKRIDLSLGREVPVLIEPMPPVGGAAGPAVNPLAPAGTPTFSLSHPGVASSEAAPRRNAPAPLFQFQREL